MEYIELYSTDVHPSNIPLQILIQDQPWRAVNIETTAKYGASFVTGNSGGCSVSSMDCPSVGYEMARKPGKAYYVILRVKIFKILKN